MSYRDGRKISGTFRADATALADVGRVHRFLRELVERIGMTALGYTVYDVPMAVKRLGQDPLADEGGVTGIVVLSTSHAAIHTWPEDEGGRFDIDSCRDFDPQAVAALIHEVFEARAIEWLDCTAAFAPAAAQEHYFARLEATL